MTPSQFACAKSYASKRDRAIEVASKRWLNQLPQGPRIRISHLGPPILPSCRISELSQWPKSCTPQKKCILNKSSVKNLPEIFGGEKRSYAATLNSITRFQPIVPGLHLEWHFQWEVDWYSPFRPVKRGGQKKNIKISWLVTPASWFLMGFGES